MKMDMTALNDKQLKVMKQIVEDCKVFADKIFDMVKECPGLYEKGFDIIVDVDPKYESITRTVSVKRTIIKDNTIVDEKHEEKRGENDEGWDIRYSISSDEFTALLAKTADSEGAEEGSNKESVVPADGSNDSDNNDPSVLPDLV